MWCRSERVLRRLPLVEPLRDERCPLLRAPAVEHVEVRRVRSQVDPGGPGMQRGVAIRLCDPVRGGAVDALHPDLAGALERRRIRVARALALPEVEDAGRVAALLGRLAPVAGRQRPVLLPAAAVHGEVALAVA